MLLSQLKSHFKNQLKDEFPATEIESFFHILLEKFMGMRRIDMALTPELEISEAQQKQFKAAIWRLKQHEPVQYITGETEFRGKNFIVDKNVLIPRPETEELVEWILKDYQNSKSGLKILDIGTGSGCIAISLAAELKEALVSAFDISEEALKIAGKNAILNKLEVNFQQVDILKKDELNEAYDLIVSNPPYVRELEKTGMHKNVLDHEPEQALYVNDANALVFYEKIASLASKSLPPGGALYFEINQYLARETKQLVEEYGFEAELKKDIFDNYRMLKALRL